MDLKLENDLKQLSKLKFKLEKDKQRIYQSVLTGSTAQIPKADLKLKEINTQLRQVAALIKKKAAQIHAKEKRKPLRLWKKIDLSEVINLHILKKG